MEVLGLLFLDRKSLTTKKAVSSAVGRISVPFPFQVYGCGTRSAWLNHSIWLSEDMNKKIDFDEIRKGLK